jgi:hypothetical protein
MPKPIPLPEPENWTNKGYDLFMIREKELNKPTQGTGSALQSSLEVTDFPDSSIDASSIKSGTLNGDFKQKRAISAVVKGSTTTLTVTDGTTSIAIPEILDGANITNALATIHTLGDSGTTTIMIRRRRNGSDVDVLSTGITVSYNEYYASDGIINPLYDDLNEGDQIYIDIDEVATGTPKGLSVVLTTF